MSVVRNLLLIVQWFLFFWKFCNSTFVRSVLYFSSGFLKRNGKLSFMKEMFYKLRNNKTSFNGYNLLLSDSEWSSI